jgi:hypothetical protein
MRPVLGRGGVLVVTDVVEVRFGDVQLLVEAVPVAGSEPTSGLNRAGERVVDAFGQVQAAIVGVASSAAEVVKRLAERTQRPDRLEVEVGCRSPRRAT